MQSQLGIPDLTINFSPSVKFHAKYTRLLKVIVKLDMKQEQQTKTSLMNTLNNLYLVVGFFPIVLG